MPLSLLCLAACGEGVDEQEQMTAPEMNPPSGESLYLEHCAGCHGDDGKGGVEKACLSVVSPHIGQQSDSKLYTFIALGTGGRMPAFDDTLEQSEIIMIIEHLRTLNESGLADD
ncbi:MAG: c-type cytochrome [Myxococcota bacterium]|nr:c-type cytochrome [Myxococcota bacterium]